MASQSALDPRLQYGNSHQPAFDSRGALLRGPPPTKQQQQTPPSQPVAAPHDAQRPYYIPSQEREPRPSADSADLNAEESDDEQHESPETLGDDEGPEKTRYAQMSPVVRELLKQTSAGERKKTPVCWREREREPLVQFVVPMWTSSAFSYVSSGESPSTMGDADSCFFKFSFTL